MRFAPLDPHHSPKAQTRHRSIPRTLDNKETTGRLASTGDRRSQAGGPSPLFTPFLPLPPPPSFRFTSGHIAGRRRYANPAAPRLSRPLRAAAADTGVSPAYRRPEPPLLSPFLPLPLTDRPGLLPVYVGSYRRTADAGFPPAPTTGSVT